jgi:hypothetical protein
MVKPSAKAPQIEKSKIVKPPSPKKKKQAPNMRENLKKKKQKPIPTLRVLGFEDPLSVEMYEYTLNENKPGFINNFRKWSRGELENDSLTEANFIGLKMQRDYVSDANEALYYDDDYARFWMIRYPPSNASTVETRQEGLRVLKTFFMSTQGTEYPPSSIETFDITTEIPAILEKYFLDDDIDEIIKASFELEDLNETFYERFTALAQTIYLQKEPSGYTNSILGFPSLILE